jgi:hypothetical protein
LAGLEDRVNRTTERTEHPLDTGELGGADRTGRSSGWIIGVGGTRGK